jgi:hypothetical protein
MFQVEKHALNQRLEAVEIDLVDEEIRGVLIGAPGPGAGRKAVVRIVGAIDRVDVKGRVGRQLQGSQRREGFEERLP